MEANSFIAKLKADGSGNDWTNLDLVFKEYKDILGKLSTKDRGPFSLNVLCILCRNLEKVPSWCGAIDHRVMLSLSVECLHETRTLDSPDQVKVLACVYHIHKHLLKQNSSIAPELVLKLSYTPFELENLIPEYCKTYWNILADRLTYIEKLKARKINILKLLPKLSLDILKVIKVYDSFQFCTTILSFMVKKLHYLFSDLDARQLNKFFGNIFEEIQSKRDLRCFKKLPDKELYDIYTKLNDCLYVIAENSSKIDFEYSVLNTAIQTCISIVGRQPDLLHCLQTIYLNGICTIMSGNQNLTYIETIMINFPITCETAEKLGYVKAMNITYPYINQFLRLHIEYNVTKNKNKWSKSYPEQLQTASLKLIEFLLKKLKNCNQLLKCEYCTIKSGLHDALRLSFLVKNFIIQPIEENLSITKSLPIYFEITLQQYTILNELRAEGCANYEKCYRKLQSDVHNTAIILNKSQNFEFSIKLFELYLKNEILHFKNENELKNISRSLYNKSICELDCKQYESALLDAYLSLIFAQPEGTTTDKYMSLVMDIKAKVLKSREDIDYQAESIDDIQMTTVLDACAEAIEKKKYGNLKPFFCNLKFSDLLRHEFEMYVKLWPSLVPIAGVWRSLRDLTQHDVPWLIAKDESIEQTLYEIILKTPSAVRTIHNENYTEIITDLVQKFQENRPESSEIKMFYATILFLKTEYDLAAASEKFQWKISTPTIDPDQIQTLRTMSEEHEATKSAVQGLEMLMELIQHIQTAPTPDLSDVLQIIQVFVPQFLHLYRTLQGLQLAYICCEIAQRIGDKKSYLTNASTILYFANRQSDNLTQILTIASKYCAELLQNRETMEIALVFLCDCAIYYTKINKTHLAAKLTQTVQATILAFYEKDPQLNLDLAVGHLLEAQVGLCKNGSKPVRTSLMSAVIAAHRHYLAVGNCATNWCDRRHRSLHLKLHITTTGTVSTTTCRQLVCWRRARSSAAAAITAAAAVPQGVLLVHTTNTAHREDLEVKIDSRLKFILGVPSSSYQPVAPNRETKSDQLFTPRQELETMLENMTFKNQTSPTSCLHLVPGFKIPDFLTHDSKCHCYACENPYSVILACYIAMLEASSYFRAKEFDIARNYFDGSLKCLSLAEKKLKSLKSCKKFEEFLVDNVENIFKEHFSKIQIETLIELAFFELSQKNYKSADEHIVFIHEILQENENISSFLKNEILHLMTTSAHLRSSIRKNLSEDLVDLEAEFENLKLSPTKPMNPAKTPEQKGKKPPRLAKIKVKDEEVPYKKPLVTKLNLGDDNDTIQEEKDTSTRKTTKRTDFKIPVPKTSKPILENVTPIPKTRQIPKMIVTQPSQSEPSTSIFEFVTPKPKPEDKSEFFTPAETPTEQFFTPMTSVKTYAKKSLRKDIVKNLESEFSTPKSVLKKQNNVDKPDSPKVVNKENKKFNSEIPKPITRRVETGSVKNLKEKRSLKRATSPGKLEKDEKVAAKPTRSSRLRAPVKLSLDIDDKNK